MDKKRKSTRGFTLVEILVAITIFSITVAGTFSAVASSLAYARHVRLQTTARWLAHEGLEIIRNARERYPSAWYSTGSKDPLSECIGTWCAVEIQPNQTPGLEFSECGRGGPGNSEFNCPPLLFNQNETTSDFLYNYSNGSETFFRRALKIKPIAPGEEYKVISKVMWGANSEFSMESTLHVYQRI